MATPGPEFRPGLEHLALMELLAYPTYRECSFPVAFWRTKSGLECDFVLGADGAVGIEVKGSTKLRPKDLHGIRAFADEHRPKLAIVVCNESAPRRTADGIWILPWKAFLERLWGGTIVR